MSTQKSRVKIVHVAKNDPRTTIFACKCGETHRLKQCCPTPKLTHLGTEMSTLGSLYCAMVCESCMAGLIWIGEQERPN